MKKIYINIIFIVFIIFLGFALISKEGNNYYFYLPDFWFGSKPACINLNETQNSSTVLAPVLDVKIDKEKNVIYCSTFQLMWKALCKDVLDEPAQIKDSPDYVAKLNSLIDLPVNVSADSYFAIAGLGNDAVKTINQSGNEKFPRIFKNLAEKLNENDMISYCALYKNLLFKNLFDNIDSVFKSGNCDTKIKAFGTEGNKENKFKTQVEIIYQNNKNKKEFIIKLNSKSVNDEIIVSSLKPEETLEKSYEKIFQYYNEYIRKNKPYGLENNSKLIIPKINFELTYNYNELEGKEILNQKFKQNIHDKLNGQNIYIKKTGQYVKFDLNEKGVMLYSFAFLTATGSHSNDFIVDGPFIIFLKEKNSKTPYFMAYIGNDELLVKR